MTLNTDPMRIILGASSLKAYVTAPKTMHVLGIVRFGLEYGLLATDMEGFHYRVNGSSVEPLDEQCVQRAIEVARRGGGRFALRTAQSSEPLAAPAPPRISIRKHRHVGQFAEA